MSSSSASSSEADVPKGDLLSANIRSVNPTLTVKICVHNTESSSALWKSSRRTSSSRCLSAPPYSPVLIRKSIRVFPILGILWSTKCGTLGADCRILAWAQPIRCLPRSGGRDESSDNDALSSMDPTRQPHHPTISNVATRRSWQNASSPASRSRLQCRTTSGVTPRSISF